VLHLVTQFATLVTISFLTSLCEELFQHPPDEQTKRKNPSKSFLRCKFLSCAGASGIQPIHRNRLIFSKGLLYVFCRSHFAKSRKPFCKEVCHGGQSTPHFSKQRGGVLFYLVGRILNAGRLCQSRISQPLDGIGFVWNKMMYWIVSNAIELDFQNKTILAT